jgi:sugar diacid utilization regulator
LHYDEPVRQPRAVADIPAPDPRAPLYQRAEAQIPQVAHQVLTAFFAASPAYRQLPHQLVDHEITEAVTRNMGVFLRSLREDRPPAIDELADQIAAAVRRAEQGVPLDMVLSTYHIAAQVGLEAMAALAGPDDLQDLLATVPALLRYLAVAVPAVAASYLNERQALHAEHREARRALLSALLAGAPAEPLAERAGLVLPEHHVVVCVRVVLPAHSDAAGRLAVRGIARRIQAELPQPALAALNHNGGTILLPASDDPAEGGSVDATELVHKLHVAAGVRLVAGIATATSLAEIPAAAQEAADIGELAERLGRPPGAYVLDDVLLEYQLCRPGAGQQRLLRVLDSLAPHPELVRTLSVFIESGHNRHQSAADLHVHCNTLNYRLRRIATLTGHNPADPADARLLAAALIIRDLLTPS